MPVVIPINYGAVLASGVAAMIIGSLWYGPLFGKQWIAMLGWSPEKMAAAKTKNNGMQYALMFVGALVMAYVLAHGIVFGNAYLKMSGTTAGVMGAFWFWLGFIAPSMLGKVLWEGKPWKLWMIDSGYYLVTLCVMGAILSSWVK